MIEMTCPHCGQVLHIADEYAGKAGRCKRCQKGITAPGVAPSTAFEALDVANVEIDVDKVAPPPVQVEAVPGKATFGSAEALAKMQRMGLPLADEDSTAWPSELQPERTNWGGYAFGSPIDVLARNLFFE